MSIKYLSFIIGLILITGSIVACQDQPNQIFIEVDGTRQSLTTRAATVREALAEADIILSPLDRVSPDLYVQLEPGLVIVVIRVREELETNREIIPFERQTIVNEALVAGETRLAQLGVNGEDEITIRVVYENDKEVSRTEISRANIIEPVSEILVIGPQDTLPSIPIQGTIAYLSNGNAWLMRSSSGSRRALTTDGNLDGRVFALSPNGRQLLYTTHLTDNIELPLNEMWLASTTIVGETPITLNIRGVLQAEWSPVISQSLLVYSTAERTANPPGWRANNDLWLLDLQKPSTRPVELLAANTQGLYPWWGATFTWSPDGTALAYARADQVGIIEFSKELDPVAREEVIVPLVDFTPFQTFSDWVWVPGVSWAPDGRFIAVVVHGPPLAAEPEEESQVFDLWLIGKEGELSVKVAQQVGMWANPAWGEAGIAFGAASDPLQSVKSRYNIFLIDKDGSNKRQLFPFREELGLQFPELVWSPDSQELLFIYNGNLFITSSAGGLPKQLSADGQASHPRWTLDQASGITTTLSLTGTQVVSGSQPLTSSNIVTVTTAVSSTATPQPALVTPALVTPVLPATPTITPTLTTTPTFTPTTITPSAGTIQSTVTITSPLQDSGDIITSTQSITTPADPGTLPP